MIFSHKKKQSKTTTMKSHLIFILFLNLILLFNWLMNQADQTIKKMNIKLNPY